MGKLAVTTFVSLDGVMQSPGLPDEDPSNGFQYGGWQAAYADEDLGRIASERLARADAFVLGRKTYESLAAYWPRVTDPDDPIASRLNALPKYVASTTLNRAEWNNTILLRENVADEVAALKQRYQNEIQVHGSGELVQTLREHGLVDVLHVWIYPVVLGAGKRLFPEGCIPSALELVDTVTTSKGAVVCTYGPAGDVTTSSFTLENANTL